MRIMHGVYMSMHMHGRVDNNSMLKVSTCMHRPVRVPGSSPGGFDPESASKVRLNGVGGCAGWVLGNII